jgi:hypothetical protein
VRAKVIEDSATELQRRIRRCLRFADPFTNRDDVRLVDRPTRSLRRWIEAPQRLDGIADEFNADRLFVPRRKDVYDATAHAELAMLVDWILPFVPGGDQLLGKVLWLDIQSRPEVDRRIE